MLYIYKAINKNGEVEDGNIEASSKDIAIRAIQKRGLIVSEMKPSVSENKFIETLPFLNTVPLKDVVTFSQQVATLFGSKVSTLKIFRMLAEETANKILKKALFDIADRIQGGSSIANAFSKHPNIFSSFYVNMIKAGEETGEIAGTFEYLAEYLDRNYEVTSKARNALIYPAFVIFTFIVIMGLMFAVVIPKIGAIVKDSGQDIPLYTKIVFGVSDFFLNYGAFIGLGFIALVIFFLYYRTTEQGKIGIDKFKLEIPLIGDLYRKLYYSRISDNMSTMIQSGVPIVRSLEIAADIMDNAVYKKALTDAVKTVKAGKPVSTALDDSGMFPNIMVAMIKIGEETGEIRSILNKISNFYKREVIDAVDTLIELIEPAMIVILGISVGFLLVSVLVPIYNISSGAGF